MLSATGGCTLVVATALLGISTGISVLTFGLEDFSLERGEPPMFAGIVLFTC